MLAFSNSRLHGGVSGVAHIPLKHVLREGSFAAESVRDKDIYWLVHSDA